MIKVKQLVFVHRALILVQVCYEDFSRAEGLFGCIIFYGWKSFETGGSSVHFVLPHTASKPKVSKPLTNCLRSFLARSYFSLEFTRTQERSMWLTSFIYFIYFLFFHLWVRLEIDLYAKKEERISPSCR